MVTSSTLVLDFGIHGGSTGCKYGIPIGGDGKTNSIHGGEILDFKNG
jgi:hypothetical protein